jgi:hypothetical protein
MAAYGPGQLLDFVMRQKCRTLQTELLIWTNILSVLLYLLQLQLVSRIKENFDGIYRSFVQIQNDLKFPSFSLLYLAFQ